MATQTVTLTVRGMHCQSCVKRVERALAGVPGVTSARVDLLEERATVDYTAGSTSEAALKQVVTGLGFRIAD